MSIQELYPAVLTLVLVGIIVGVGMYVLSTLGGSISGSAGTKINETASALGGFVSWMPIIVVIIAAAIIIGLVMRSFIGGGGGRRK